MTHDDRTGAPDEISAHALRDSEVAHKALFEAAYDAMFILKDKHIIDCNPRAVELLGIEREKLLSLHFRDIVPDEWIEQIRQMRKGAPPGEKGLSRYRFPHQTPAGHKRSLSVERHALPGEGEYSLVFFNEYLNKFQFMYTHQRFTVNILMNI